MESVRVFGMVGVRVDGGGSCDLHPWLLLLRDVDFDGWLVGVRLVRPARHLDDRLAVRLDSQVEGVLGGPEPDGVGPGPAGAVGGPLDPHRRL